MWMISCTCMRVESYSCTSVFVHITRHKYIYLSVFFMFSFSSASVYFHLFHPHNNHLSPNSPRLMFLFVKCATVNKVYLILSYLIAKPRWRGQRRSRHSRRIRNPQFCVSGKRPITLCRGCNSHLIMMLNRRRIRPYSNGDIIICRFQVKVNDGFRKV